MHFSLFIIGHRVLLQTVGYDRVVYDKRFIGRSGIGYQVDDVEQLPRVAAGIAEESRCFPYVDISFLQLFVGFHRTVEKMLQMRRIKGFKYVNLTAGEQRAYDFERRVFGRCSDKSYRTIFDCSQQRVLLGLVETVYFVDKQNRSALLENTPAFTFVDDFTYLFYSRVYGTQCIKRRFELNRDDTGQSRFPDTGRPP